MGAARSWGKTSSPRADSPAADRSPVRRSTVQPRVAHRMGRAIGLLGLALLLRGPAEERQLHRALESAPVLDVFDRMVPGLARQLSISPGRCGLLPEHQELIDLGHLVGGLPGRRMIGYVVI